MNSMKRSGFTIVEIVVTITVMGIILALAVVNVSNSQVRARDEERRSDAESIARHLESFYLNGTGDAGEEIGRYPSAEFTSSLQSVREKLVNIDPKSLAAPDVDYDGDVISLISATNTVQSEYGVAPSPTVDQYVYQPLAWNGTGWGICTGSQECRKFNLFYRLEADDSIYKIDSRNR